VVPSIAARLHQEFLGFIPNENSWDLFPIREIPGIYSRISACQWWCAAALNLATANRPLMRAAAVRDAHAALRRVVGNEPAATQQWQDLDRVLS
jgi:hypothetical protein